MTLEYISCILSFSSQILIIFSSQDHKSFFSPSIKKKKTTFEWQNCHNMMNIKGRKETSLEWPKSVNSRTIRNSQLASSSVSCLSSIGENLYSGIRTDICRHSLQWMILLTWREVQFQSDLERLHRWWRFFSWLSQPPPGKSFIGEAVCHPLPINCICFDKSRFWVFLI